MMILLGSNPVMCKIKYINRQTIDSTTSISAVVGSAFHKALETYYGGNDELAITSEDEAIRLGLQTGLSFLEHYNDGWIKYTTTIPNKQKAQEVLAFLFGSYVKEVPYNNGDEIIATEEKFEEMVEVEWRGKDISLPVKLKGYPDKVVRKDGRIKIVDYKSVAYFSKPDKIDGAKIIAAVHYYFLVYAKYGVEPYSMIYEEVKNTPNRDKSAQVQKYEIVYAENELFFDFYFRYYEDVTRALNGEMVYLPNVHAMFDGDISIIAYAHRLDQEEEVAKQMKKLKVENITDLLKKKIHSARSMKKFLATVERDFISAKNLNYAKMKNEEKIQTKLMEHGLMVQYDSKVDGHAYELYRYTPSIGLKMSRVENYVADVEQALGMSGVRILAPIPGTSWVGFEVPKQKRTFPSGKAQNDGYKLAIGVDVLGVPYLFDITTAPHLLVAGSTGSGKSVFLSSLINQLARVPDTELHLFDPKRVELAHHRKDKGVVEYAWAPNTIHDGLCALVEEMEARYEQLVKKGVKNISEYPGMPRKFVVIDEFGDLIVQKHTRETPEVTGVYTRGQYAGQEKVKITKEDISQGISDSILTLAQKARAAGIHLIITTQRPSVDIISGTIKSNFPTKAVFRTAKAIDSQVVLDENGAEKLLGMGDMIFTSHEGTVRLQGYRG